ncbi:hypothetical protein M407DRAFT_24510 [Tulasnella calospora MUT 4182]|uniref:Uncharacterized protein n=1 Tax=Tulasnella calospora MUT 4182 TaxID=1051891 RepID=A0A0C3LXI7_9AGAM|nr:hypothetical protein M407DRAFT_24510 [Tulasnella calospora MUT 4182]
MPKSSVPDFTPQQYKITSDIIKPVAKLNIKIIGDLLISGGRSSRKAAGHSSFTSSETRLSLRPGVGKFVEAIIKQMQKTEEDYEKSSKGDAVELGLHWLFGHSLERLVLELKWTTKNHQTCLYQSIWNLIILWAGSWSGDPFSCSLFKRACKQAKLKEFSKVQFECALKIFKDGRKDTPDADSILLRNPRDYDPMFLTFKDKGGSRFEGMTVMFGYEPNAPTNSDFPVYITGGRQDDSQAALGDDQVLASAAPEPENSGIPMDGVQEEPGQSAPGVGPDGGNVSKTSDAIHQHKGEYIPTGLDLNTSNTHPGGGTVAAGAILDSPVTAAQPLTME